MVAIVTSNGLGLEKSSAKVLGGAGQLGSASLGRANDGVTVNAATGNLLIQNRDELLIGAGVDVSVNRTYNSLGQFTDDNGDNWRLSNQRKITNITGTANSSGSTFTLVDGDGSELVYSWDASRGSYTNKDGDGAYRTGYLAGQYWRLLNGSNTVEEQYDNANGGRLIWVSNQDRAIWNTYSYDASGRLATIGTGDGSATTLSWSGNNLSQLTSSYTDLAGATKTLTRTRYTYDGYNRLATVTTDLSPEDSSIVDGRTYVTTYAYAGASKLVSSITQTDGSRLDLSYDGSNRIYQIIQTVEAGVTRTTTFSYGANYTTITDPQGNATTMYYVSSGANTGQLDTVIEPPTVVGGNPRRTVYTYTTNGDLATATVYDGAVSTATIVSQDNYQYDANGNLTEKKDVLGDTARYTYGSQNQRLTETRFAVASTTAPSSPFTTRYAYDSENHLRFTISPEGRVTEYLYDALGQLISTIDYTAANPYAGATATETDLTNWLASSTNGIDKTAIQRTDTVYDFRGNVSTTISFSKTDSAGNGLLSADYTTTFYIYDQAGQLLSQHVAESGPSVITSDVSQLIVGGALTPSVVAAGTNQYVYNGASSQYPGVYNNFTVNAGDNITARFTLKGAGGNSFVTFGLYGNTANSAWASGTDVTARIISGPGTLAHHDSTNVNLWDVSGLSASQATQIEVTRTYTQTEGGSLYIYP